MRLKKVPGTFDTIICNPPHKAGRKLCFQIITESFDHLDKNATLQLVARHQKGGKELAKKMNEIFGNVQDGAKKSGFS